MLVTCPGNTAKKGIAPSSSGPEPLPKAKITVQGARVHRPHPETRVTRNTQGLWFHLLQPPHPPSKQNFLSSCSSFWSSPNTHARDRVVGEQRPIRFELRPSVLAYSVTACEGIFFSVMECLISIHLTDLDLVVLKMKIRNTHHVFPGFPT